MAEGECDKCCPLTNLPALQVRRAHSFQVVRPGRIWVRTVMEEVSGQDKKQKPKPWLFEGYGKVQRKQKSRRIHGI